PWRMRAPIKNSTEGAMAERKELTVKRSVQSRKKRRRPRRAVSQPVAGRMMALAAREDVGTQGTSSRAAESAPWLWGRATLVMLVSRIWSTDTSITEAVMAQRRALLSAGSVGMGRDDNATAASARWTSLGRGA